MGDHCQLTMVYHVGTGQMPMEMSVLFREDNNAYISPDKRIESKKHLARELDIEDIDLLNHQ